MKRRFNSSGFTLIELTISLAILASLMLAIVLTFIVLLHQQELVISMRTANQTARTAIDDITYEARLSSHAKVIPDPVNSQYVQLCLYTPSQMIQYYVADPVGSGSRSTLYRAALAPGASCTAIPNTNTGNFAVTSTDTDIASFGAWQGVDSSSAITKPESITFNLQVAHDRTLLVSGVCPGGSYVCAISQLEASVDLQGNPGP